MPNILVRKEIMEVLNDWERICIIGGPKTGKTTMSRELVLNRPRLFLRHTDDLISEGWSQSSEIASHWFDEPGPWIIEGTMAVRALRKWIDGDPLRGTEHPFVVVYLTQFHETLKSGQISMAGGVRKIVGEISFPLMQMGIHLILEKG